jgi:hypothetical protein
VSDRRTEQLGDASVERFVLASEPGLTVPVLAVVPARAAGVRGPAVVMFAQGGKGQLLRERAGPVAEFLAGGVAVFLADVRGTGETAAGGDRGRTGESTSLSQGELLLGRTMLGGRLRDLRAVLRHVRGRPDVDPARLGLWGDSFAPPNPPDRKLDVPLDAGGRRDLAEPLGGMLALLGMLFEEDVRAAYARGGLSSYASCLRGPFLFVPHDAVVPGAMTAGDWADITAAVEPRPIRLDAQVDGMNRRTAAAAPADADAPARWLSMELNGR